MFQDIGLRIITHKLTRKKNKEDGCEEKGSDDTSTNRGDATRTHDVKINWCPA